MLRTTATTSAIDTTLSLSKTGVASPPLVVARLAVEGQHPTFLGILVFINI